MPPPATRLHVLRAHRGGVFATRFSADGTRLATLGADRAVRVWDVRTGRQLQAFVGVHERTSAGIAWGEGVAFVGRDRIAVSPWSRGSAPSRVVAKVFDISSGKRVAVVEDPAGVEARVVDLDVSRDGTLLVAAQAEGGLLQLYGLPSGKQLDVVHAHGGAVLDVEFSRDGRRVATGGVDGVARVWEVARGKLREALTLRGHANPVGSVSFDRTGTRLVTLGQHSGEARVWDVSPAGRGEVLTLPGPQTDEQPDIAFTPDGRRLVAGSGREGTVRVWSIDTGAELLVLDQHARTRAPVRAVIGIDVSPDGSRIATAGADGSARIFDAETGRQLIVVRRRATAFAVGLLPRQPRRLQPGRLEDRNDGPGRHRSHLRRGHRSSAPRAARAQAGRLRDLPGRVEPGRRRLLSTAPDGTRIWDARTGRQLLALPLTGGPGLRLSGAPTAAQVLTESGLGPAVWDASTGKRLRTLETDAAVGGPGVQPRRIAGSRARRSTSGPTLSRIWDWPAGVETLKLRDGGLRVALSPDGRLLAGVRQRQPVPFVHVWALDPELLLRIARSRVTRSLTEEECRRYLQRPCPEGG